MKKKDAFKLMEKYYPMFRKSIPQLMCFEKGMTAPQFANKANITITRAYQIINQYKLISANSNVATIKAARRRKELSLRWDSKKTIRENATLLKVSIGLADRIQKEFNFQFIDHKNDLKRKRIRKILLFRKNGLNDSEISRVLGLSRERVRQLGMESKKWGLTS